MFNCNHYESDSVSKQTIIIRGPDSPYYNNLVSTLITESIDVCCCTDDIDFIVEQILEIKPCFAILSFTRDDFRIIEYIRVIRKYSASTHIVMQLSAKVVSSINTDSLNVSGFILENASSSEMVECLKKILNGFRFLSPHIQHIKATHIFKELHSPVCFTKQERKIMELMAAGVTGNQELATVLYCSPHTIKNHKTHLMEKLNLNNIHDLYFVARQGLYSTFFEQA